MASTSFSNKYMLLNYLTIRYNYKRKTLKKKNKT